MKKYSPDVRSLFYLRLSIIILASGVSAAIFVAVSNLFIVVGSIAVISVAALFYAFYYIPRYFKALQYFIDYGEIVRRSGVLFSSRKRVRIDSVQSVSLITVPFSDYTGFNCLMLYFYGGRLMMPFLRICDTEEIISLYLEMREKNVS